MFYRKSNTPVKKMKTSAHILCLMFVIIIKFKESQSTHIEDVKELEDPTQFPFFAQLRCPMFGKLGKVTRCGGTLIHPKWILTAAHCFPNSTEEIEWLLHQTIPMVFMGSIRTFDFLFGVTNFIIRILRHPHFSWRKRWDERDEFNNDIAVVELRNLYLTNPVVQTIALRNSFGKCHDGTLIGIGLTFLGTTENFSTNVKYTNLTIQNYSKLTKSNDLHTPSTFYTIAESGGDLPGSNGGSSGGPFVCTIGSVPVQIGILSWSVMFGKSVRSTFERVDLYADFISEHVHNDGLHFKNQLYASASGQNLPTLINSNYNVVCVVFVCIFVLFFMPFLLECDCERRIGEGIETDDSTKFPFFAQLQRPIMNNPRFMKKCGASLIHPKWILTAGHCFPENERQFAWLLKQKFDMVFMGSAQAYSALAVKNSFKKIVRHPNYRPIRDFAGEIAENDIALAELRTPYLLSPTIQTIHLSSGFEQCDKGIMVGVGRTQVTDPFSHSKHIKYADLKIKPSNEVNYTFYRTQTTFYTDTYKDIKESSGEGYPLKGDSGGPFFCMINSKPVQIGVFSGGGATEKTIFCIYERVDKHLKFITRHVPFVMIQALILESRAAGKENFCGLIIFCICLIFISKNKIN